MLYGLMQSVPLTLNMVRERVGELYPGKTVVTRFSSGFHSCTYGELLERAGRVANLLKDFGLRRGDRVATLAWNSHRHLEVYVAVPCMGAVLHTVNARLAARDVATLLDHAGDTVLFVDHSIWRTLGNDFQLPDCIRHVVVCEDEDPEGAVEAPRASNATLGRYEDLLAGYPSAFAWPSLDEKEAAGLCYTSGTTGDPKGVLYSHRSTTLHTLSCLFADGVSMRERDVCMPAVPMFHANAWGFPYAALMAGASLALPSRQTDPQSLVELIERAKVTIATAVPTVWTNFLEFIKSNQAATGKIQTLKRLPIGGAAVSRSLIDGFSEFGIQVMHCWGMTEISPLGLTNLDRSDVDAETLKATRTAQGLAVPGCSVRVVDGAGRRCPTDGRSSGELQISSPWAASAYFPGSAENVNRAQTSFVYSEGREWLRTGDVATIDSHGYVRIVDRTKDLIKSGGEWISSQELELQLMNHPAVREAAVVARADVKWQERPVACISLRSDNPEERQRFVCTMQTFLARTFPKWQIPKDVKFWDELPKGKTGKIDKNALRDWVAGTEFDRAEI